MTQKVKGVLFKEVQEEIHGEKSACVRQMHDMLIVVDELEWISRPWYAKGEEEVPVSPVYRDPEDKKSLSALSPKRTTLHEV